MTGDDADRSSKKQEEPKWNLAYSDLTKRLFPRRGKDISGAVNFHGSDSEYDSELEDENSGQHTQVIELPEPFRHESLPEGRWIRLIKLYPGSGKDPIVVELFHCELDDVPPYEAISYVWGEENETKEILCNGKSLYIRLNLYLALRRFRRRSTPRTLWADFICINQSETTEKGHQVNIMGEIFSRAEMVLAWLGSDDENRAQIAFDFISEFYRAIFAQLEKIESDWINALRSIKYPNPPDLEEKLNAVNTITNNKYFRRVWIVQEIGLAQSVRLYSGIYFINFSVFVTYLQVLSQGFNSTYDHIWHGRLLCRIAAKVWLTYPLSNARTWTLENGLLHQIKNISRGKLGLPDFSEVLETIGNHYEASDSRDFIYALLGHPSARREGKLIIEADYSMSMTQLNQSLSTAFAIKSTNLHYLHTIYHQTNGSIKENAEFPSWAMKWGTRRSRSLFKSAIHDRIIQDESESCVGGILEDNKRLHVEGLLLDIITFRSKHVFSKDFNDSDAAQALEGSWDELIVANNAPTKEVVSLVVRQGSADWFDVYTIFFLDAYKFAKLTSIDKLKSDIELLKATYKKQFRILERSGRGHPVNCLTRAKKTFTGRRHFMTAGGYVGIGPRILENGDVCCFLFGAAAIFIVRPMKGENEYKLVGVAYVAGLMDGQIGRMWKAGDLVKQPIILC
jgi:hypothetical protein